jgi:hypothetical protein
MRRIPVWVVALGLGTHALAQSARAETRCEMNFKLSGWSVFYQTGSGTGVIWCDNGQSAPVRIKTKGGGFTVGKTKVVDGEGAFSEVDRIDEVFGTYARAEAQAGAGKEAEAQVLTKGTVSLALRGKGRGVGLGVSVGSFTITWR